MCIHKRPIDTVLTKVSVLTKTLYIPYSYIYIHFNLSKFINFCNLIFDKTIRDKFMKPFLPFQTFITTHFRNHNHFPNPKFEFITKKQKLKFKPTNSIMYISQPTYYPITSAHPVSQNDPSPPLKKSKHSATSPPQFRNLKSKNHNVYVSPPLLNLEISNPKPQRLPVKQPPVKKTPPNFLFEFSRYIMTQK